MGVLVLTNLVCIIQSLGWLLKGVDFGIGNRSGTNGNSKFNMIIVISIVWYDTVYHQ